MKISSLFIVTDGQSSKYIANKFIAVHNVCYKYHAENKGKFKQKFWSEYSWMWESLLILKASKVFECRESFMWTLRGWF